MNGISSISIASGDIVEFFIILFIMCELLTFNSKKFEDFEVEGHLGDDPLNNSQFNISLFSIVKLSDFNKYIP
jgi:hypothetical protein